MPKIKLYRWVPILLGFFLILYYSLLFLKANPQSIEKDLTRSIEMISGGQFQSGSFQLGYFPTLQSEFKDVTLTLQDPAPVSYRAQKLKIYFGFWGFLFGKANITAVEFEDAALQVTLPQGAPFRSVDVEHVYLRARMLDSFQKVQVQIKGDLEGVANSLSGKVLLDIEDPLKRDWTQVFMDGDIEVKEFPLAILESPFLKSRNIQIKNGKVSGQYHLRKEKQDPWLYVSGHSQVTDLIYEVKNESNHLITPAAGADLDLEIGWQPLEDQMRVKRSLLNLPFGKVQLSGQILAGNREVKDVRVSVSDLMLDILPQYYLPFREAVPFNLGFSGESDLEMSLEGALDHLTLHGNWDLSPSFLNYAGFFSKPKDIPCNLSFDLLLKDSQSLSGDFSLKLHDAGFKGTLSRFDLRKGEGDLNILSNKFHLEHWAPLLPAFSGYTLNGEIKFLANFSGTLLRNPETLKRMVNIILEKGEIAKDNDALKEIYFALDYNPMSVEIKEGQVLAGNRPLFFNLTLFDPKTNPHAKINLHSDQADMTKLLNSVEAVGEKWLPEKAKTFLSRLRPGMQALVPEGQTLNQLQVEIEAKEKNLLLKKLKCEIYGGEVSAQGKMTQEQDSNPFEVDLKMDRLNLARFFSRDPTEPKVILGNLFFEGNFSGKNISSDQWQEDLAGKGRISITNGEFSSFDILKTASSISGFSMLSSSATETTPFDDFRTDFELESGKVMTENATLISRSMKVLGDGEVSLTGLINYRLDAYLSMAAVKDIAGNFWTADEDSQDGYLGPIPMLLSGDWIQPELKTDPSKIAEFTENFAKKKTQKVLRNFLPEDVLFRRPASNP